MTSKMGRPRKEKTQSPEERAAYLREYNQRPEVIERRKEYNRRAYQKLLQSETAEERRERLDYRNFMRKQKKLQR